MSFGEKFCNEQPFDPAAYPKMGHFVHFSNVPVLLHRFYLALFAGHLFILLQF